MKRLIRRTRRNLDRANKIFTNLLKSTRAREGYLTPGRSALSVEPLENRVLLTTIVLEKGDVGETIFTYSDPEENDNAEITIFNELRIGTLSGQGPEKDVVVEVYGYDYYDDLTLDVPGTIEYSDGITETIAGGPGGGPIYSLLDETGYEISALASDASGNTYGISAEGMLLKFDSLEPDAVDITEIGLVQDTNNLFAQNITFTDFYSADIAWGWADVDEDEDGFFDGRQYRDFKEVIYAVVGADIIDHNGNNFGLGSVLIMIDPLTGEAEPVGEVNDRSSYLASEITLTGVNEDGDVLNPNISTIVFSQEPGHNAAMNTTEPLFVAFNAATHRFVSIAVDVAISGDTTVVNRNITQQNDGEDELVVSGLAYCDYNDDGDTDLFATTYNVNEQGERADGVLNLLALNGLGANFLGNHAFTEVVTLDQHEGDAWDQQPRLFSGFTFDPIGNMGYATEDFTGEIYQVNLAELVENDDGDGFTINGQRDIYHMYIASCTADTYITLTRYELVNNEIVYTPNSGEPAYMFSEGNPPVDYYSPDNAGGAALGTHAYALTPDETVYAGLTFNMEPGQTAPAPESSFGGTWQGGRIRPGIVVEEGNDLGLISIGGPVFGDVDVRGGSIGTFYSGFLGTNQFVVNGDLQSLIAGTEAGGINATANSWQPALNELDFYVRGYGITGDSVSLVNDESSCVLDVVGSLGSFYSGDDWGLPVRVWGYDIDQDNDQIPDPFPGVYNYMASDTADDINRDVIYYDVYREMEDKGDFNLGAFGNIINNDSIEAAQILTTRNYDGKISVVGSCESTVDDPEDYYGIGVMAGDELKVKLFYTQGNLADSNVNFPYVPNSQEPDPGTVAVYDPNGNIIAISGEVDPLTDTYLPISFTAEIAGIYTVMVTGSTSYRLDVEGVTETALGGGNVLGDLRSVYYNTSESRPAVQLLNGNLGALNVNGFAGMSQILVPEGDIKGVRVNGTDDPGTGYAGFSPELTNQDGTITTAVNPQIVAGGSIGEVRVAGPSMVNIIAGEDVQSVYAAQELACGLMAGDDIGTVYVGGSYSAGAYGVDSFILANADGDADPGIIDSIVVEETLSAVVSTGRNVTGTNGKTASGAGNVRFVSAQTGGVVREVAFDIGQSAIITDDSGARVVLSPGYEGTEEQVENADGTITWENLDGGALTVTLMPVYSVLPEELYTLDFIDWPAAGNAIVSVDSTDGLRVTTRSGAPAEIGTATVAGVEDNSVIISGSAPISILRLEVGAPATVDGTDEDEAGSTGINTIINRSGWYLDQNGDVFIGKGYQRRTQWVGGDMLSIVVGDVDTGASDGGTGGTEDGEDFVYNLTEVTLRGNLGYTENSTGQIIVAPLVFEEVRSDAEPGGFQDITPGGAMYNGLYSSVSTDTIKIYGRLSGGIFVSASVDQIIMNADRSEYIGQFDGISAAIVVNGDLDYINVGDGLLHPGTGEWAKAGIFVMNDLGRVLASGEGHDIAGPILASGAISQVHAYNGASIIGYNYVGSFNCASIASYAFFSEFYIAHEWASTAVVGGEYSLGEIVVKGRGSEISGAYIRNGNTNRILVTGGAEGITNSYIDIGGSFANLNSDIGIINTLSVCGYGIRDSYISLGYNARKISVTRGGDITGSVIYADWSAGTVIADNIINTNIIGLYSNTNTIGRIIARESIENFSISTGSVRMIRAGGDILGSTIFVAGKLNIVSARGDLISDIIVKGPNGELGRVVAGGDFGTNGIGSIVVDGHIGVINIRGDFRGELYLNESSQHMSDNAHRGYELRSLIVGGLLNISGNVYGDIGTISTTGNFGATGESLDIHGDLRNLVVGRGRDEAELLANLNVDGSVGTIRTTGDIEGDISVGEDVGRIIVNRSTKENGTHGLLGDVSVGGDLKSILVRNGDINYNGLNVTGDTGTMRTVGCNLYGTTVLEGDADGLDLTGSIEDSYVVIGDVKEIRLTGHYVSDEDYREGSIGEDAVILIDGDLGTLYVSDDIKGTIYVTGNIGKIYADNIEGASIIVGGDIGSIVVRDAVKDNAANKQSLIVVGFDPGSGGVIDPADFAKIDGKDDDNYWHMSDWTGQSWADPQWDYDYWYQADAVGHAWSKAEWSTIDWNDPYAVDALQGEITQTYLDYIQAEVVDTYMDYLMNKFTIQGDVIDPAEVATTGNIGTIKIGLLINSSIVAGVSPGSDGRYGDTDGTDKAGDGVSKIGRAILGAKPTGEPGDVYGIFADGDISRLIVGREKWDIPVQLNYETGFRSWEVPEVEGFDLEAEPGKLLLDFEAGDPLTYNYGDGSITFTMRGNGRALVQIDTATGNIAALQLKDTDSRTNVRVSTKGLDHELEVGRIFTNDDSSLNSLQIDGTLVYSDTEYALSIGGDVRVLMLNGIDSTDGGVDDQMNLKIGGSVTTLRVATMTADVDTQMVFDINGQLNKALVTSVSSDVYLTADSIGSFNVAEDFSGNLSSEGLISSFVVRGDYDGMLYADGDLNRVMIRGKLGAVRYDDRPESTIAATGNIRTVLAGGLSYSAVVAGENLYNVRVIGDMLGGSLVAGVSLAEYSDLRSNQAVVGEGDVGRVLVTGDFQESNIAAGVAPGADGYYSSSDDKLNQEFIDKFEPPTIEDVVLSKDMCSIEIIFADSNQSSYSDIGRVTIKGEIKEAFWNGHDYAIIAAGTIGRVTEGRTRYSGDGQLELEEIDYKTLNSSLINMSVMDMDDVAASPVWVQVDGLDQRFSTSEAIFQGMSDDSFVHGAGVTLSYDQDNNSIIFRAEDGLLENNKDVSYYRIIVRSDMIENVMGINLDGEYTGDFPTGDGIAGGNFVQAFAIADIGDTSATAFTPFDDQASFPTNKYWEYTSKLGDNRNYTGKVSMLDNDYYKINGLEEGQYIGLKLSDLNVGNGSWYVIDGNNEEIYVDILKVEEHAEFSGYDATAVISMGDGNIPMVSSEVTELFWSGDSFYGYDSESGTFLKIEVIDTGVYGAGTVSAIDQLENNLADINAEIRTQGMIESLSAFSGHNGDSFWAIADYTPNNGVTRSSLVMIRNIESDLDYVLGEQLEVEVSAIDLESLGIVGLAEGPDFIAGGSAKVLYGISSVGDLYQIDNDVESATYGQATSLGLLKDSYGDDITDINVTGLSVSRESDGLLVLHEQNLGDYSSDKVDGIYKVTFDSNGVNTTVFSQNLDNEDNVNEYHGLAANPNGYILVGMPSFGSPVDDIFEVAYDGETQTMVFGSDDIASLRGGLVTVTSDPDQLSQNYESFSFIENNMYYAMTIEYDNDLLKDDVVIEINDIDFTRDVEIDGEIVKIADNSIIGAAYSDNPQVDIQVVAYADDFGNVSSSLVVTIAGEYAGGDANIYFSANPGVIFTLTEFEVDNVGQISGTNARTNTDAIDTKHDLIVPDLSELTVSPVIMATATVLNADHSLDYNLYRYLSTTLYNQLGGVITPEIIADVNDELDDNLALLQDFTAALETISYDALGYDSEQELFVLVNSVTFDSRPIVVSLPLEDGASGLDDTYQTEMTLSALSTLYNNDNQSSSVVSEITYTIDSISGLEFGGINEEVEQGETTPDGLTIQGGAQLWAIVNITKTTDYVNGDLDVEQAQKLVRIDDILMPAENIKVAEKWDLGALGYSDITELAYGIFPDEAISNPEINRNANVLYGLDTQTNTLLKFDTVERIRQQGTGTVENPDFGLPATIGTIDSSYQITGMDFDSTGRLMAVDDGMDCIVQISTDIAPGARRAIFVEDISAGDYSAFTFDSVIESSAPVLVRNVEGTVTDDTMLVRVAGGSWGTYDFGSTATISGVTISSSDTAELADGFYKIDFSYTGDQGTVRVELDDIDWSEYGSIDSVFLTNATHAIIVDNDNDSIVIEIDTDAGAGGSRFSLYFGATSDIVRPGLSYNSTSLVYFGETPMTDGILEIYGQIPESGDYLIRVGFMGTDMPEMVIKYDLELAIFDDGDSAFGDVATTDGFIYDSPAPSNSPIDLSSDDHWAADEYEQDTYHLDRGVANSNTTRFGDYLVPGEAGSMTILSDLAFYRDVDIYEVQLTEGQIMSVSIDSLKYTGGDDVEFLIGVYNSDLEALATVYDVTVDTGEVVISSDPDYTVQAINTVPGQEHIILDPMDNVGGVLTGTYYIAVSMNYSTTSSGLYDTNDFGDSNYYSLNISTTEGGADKIKKYTSPQLVYVSFSSDNTSSSKTNVSADFLKDEFPGAYSDANIRDPFKLSDFPSLPRTFVDGQDDLDNDGVVGETVDVTWEFMRDAITRQIERVYQEALDDPTTPDVREDQQLIKITNDPDEARGKEFTTIVIGGDYPLFGLAGISQTVDRHNEYRDDMCTVGSKALGNFYNQYLDSESDRENVLYAITAIAGTAVHELGHALGLEHSTEVNPDLANPVGSAGQYIPNNVMNYNDVNLEFVGAKFEERCQMASTETSFSYTIFQPGYQNEIDSLLRNLATHMPAIV